MAEGQDQFDWRSGLVQAIGIILGFSLGFLGSWSLAEGDWEPIHLPALITLIAGSIVLIASLYRLTLPKHRNSDPATLVRLFTVGIALTLVGFVLTVVAAWIRGY